MFLLKEVLDALAELHRQSGDLAHGAIAPERIVLADGKVRIADYVLGPGIEQLRYTTERYWKELRVAVPSSAGGARLDRRVDVVQAGSDGRGDVRRKTAARHRALERYRRCADEHLDPAADPQLAASSAAHGSAARVRARWRSVEGAHGGDERERAATGSARSRSSAVTVVESRPARGAEAVGPHAYHGCHGEARSGAQAGRRRADAPKRDVWQTHDVAQPGFTQPGTAVENGRKPLNAMFKKFLLVAGIIGLMTAAFTAAQFIPAPEWMFTQTGTLVIESTPQGVKVSVNGKPQGVTPLTLKVEAGIHEVELHGPGRPKIFKVHVTRGDRVAQYIEFVRPPIITQSHIIEGSRWLSSDPSVLFAPIRLSRTGSPPFPTMSSTRRKRARLPAAIR